MEQSKQERKEQALEEYRRIEKLAWAELKRIATPAYEEYRRIEKLARAELELKLRAIEAEEGLA